MHNSPGNQFLLITYAVAPGVSRKNKIFACKKDFYALPPTESLWNRRVVSYGCVTSLCYLPRGREDELHEPPIGLPVTQSSHAIFWILRHSFVVSPGEFFIHA